MLQTNNVVPSFFKLVLSLSDLPQEQNCISVSINDCADEMCSVEVKVFSYIMHFNLGSWSAQ